MDIVAIVEHSVASRDRIEACLRLCEDLVDWRVLLLSWVEFLDILESEIESRQLADVLQANRFYQAFPLSSKL